jgi:Protein of unknown function (DUF2795)/Rho termination factor, N-terminal domain
MAMEVWTYRDSTVRGLDLTGFEVEALDGMLGRVERTASESTGGYLVVDAGTQAPLGGRVLIPAGVIDTVDVDSERVFVRLTREQIRSAPAYDWQAPLGERERQEFGAYYGATRPATALGRATRTQPSRQTRGDGGRRRVPASRDEKTKQQLYDEAKKLGIEGRSKMSKAELARAIERHRGASASGSSAKANPVEVQKFLEGVGYPTGKRDLVKEAKDQGASAEVRKTLERLPDKRFKTPTDVSEAIGKLRR